jgi:hypothetical protein
MNRKISFLLIALFNLVSIIYAQLVWKEYDKNPVFDPIRDQQAENPCVLYDQDKFSPGGPPAFYAMWFATEEGIALAYSNNGKDWTEYNKSRPLTGLKAKGNYPYIIYDPKGFKTNSFSYRIWYWSGITDSIESIRTAESVDGINWMNDQPIQQHLTDTSLQLIVGPGLYNNYFYHIYGPGSILYNPSCENIGSSTPDDKTDDQPLTYNYIIYYNSSSEGLSPEGSIIQTSLAYSVDGIYWTRYGNKPVVIPSGDVNKWDGLVIYNARTYFSDHKYRLVYSGDNRKTNIPFGNGIGYGYSVNGIDWSFYPEPFIYPESNMDWKSNGIFGASIIDQSYELIRWPKKIPKYQKYQMWYSGMDFSNKTIIGFAESISWISQPMTIKRYVTANPKSGFIPLAVTFQGFCMDCMDWEDCFTYFAWYFDDGDFIESKYDVSHVFQYENTYHISTVLIECWGSENDYFTLDIKAMNPLSGCFIIQLESGFVPLTVSFDAGCSKGLNNVPIISYSWDFDDDQYGSGKNVAHTFTRPGDYYVVLEITNKDGIKQTSHRKITVLGVLPPASISLQRMEDRSLFRKNWFNNITWASNAGNSGITITKYNIYRKLSSQPDSEYSIISSVDVNTFEFTDINIKQDEKYSYVLTTIESGGHESAFSNPVAN